MSVPPLNAATRRIPSPEVTRISLWRTDALILSVETMIALVVSWQTPATRALWDQFDERVFWFANSACTWGKASQAVWGVANWRGFDVISGCAVVLLLWSAMRRRGRNVFWRELASLAVIGTAIFAVKFGTSTALDRHHLDYRRQSPSLVYEDCQRLSSLVTWLDVKDSSRCCFPGDHGFLLFSIALYLTYCAASREACVAWLLSLLLIAPRLVAGGHWFSDIAVGSATMALGTTALVMATPLHDTLVRLMTSTGVWVRARLAAAKPAA